MTQHKFDHGIVMGVIDSVECLEYRYIEDKIFQAFLGIHGLTYVCAINELTAIDTEDSIPKLLVYTDIDRELCSLLGRLHLM